MKAAKLIGKILLWIVGIVLALVLTLPLWIGPVVKPIANAIVPMKTGTAFNLGELCLNQYNGRLTVGDLQLSNPEDFKQKMAFTLGQLNVDVDMGTVTSDTIVIEDITIKDIFVSYVSNDKGENNFDLIVKNATGGKEKKAGDKVKDEGKQEKVSSQASTSQTSQTSQTKSSKKKVIIDHFKIEKVLVQLGPVSFPVPSIELNGIGRDTNGTTFDKAWDTICAKVMSSLNAVGDFAGQLGKMGADLGKMGLDQAGKAIDAVKKLDVKGATDAFKGGAGKVSEATGKTVDAVGKGASKAVDAVGESTGKAVDAIKGLFGK